MQKILVARPIFPDVIERLKQYFEVDWNNGEVLPADELTQRLADKDGALPAGDPADPGTVIGPLITPAALGRASTPWRPWRAYAVQHLWATGTHAVNRLPA